MSTHSWLKSSATVRALQAPTVGQAVADEVHAPNLVDRWWPCSAGNRSAGGLRTFLRLRTARFAALYGRRYTRLWFTPEVRAQQIVDAPVAESPAYMGDLDDPFAKASARGGIGLWRVPVAVAGEPTSRQARRSDRMVLADHLADRLALGLWASALPRGRS